MAKWILKAMEPGQSNLHMFLCFRLQHFQPYSQGRWHPSLEYFLIPKHQAKGGSIVWNRVTTAWKTLLPHIVFVRPKCRDELLTCSWWWWASLILELQHYIVLASACTEMHG